MPRTLHLLLIAAALAGCPRNADREAAPPPPPAETTAKGGATDAKAPAMLSDALPAALRRATPADPLTPRPPEGPTARNGPGPARGGPLDPAKLRVPDGFVVERYAADVPNARSLALGPKGTVFVSTRKGSEVYAVRDTDGDYAADEVHVIARGLDSPNGIAYRDGDLYVAAVDRLLVLEGIMARLEDPPEPKVLADDFPDQRGHGWRYIRFGPDGMLYMPIGAPCNVCDREEPIFATILRMKPDGTGREIFAKGVRNSVGFDWHPETRELWFTENGRDEIGDDIPPDELNRAPKTGLHFGFPHCHGGVIRDPEFGEGRPCADFEPPVGNLGPHVAALGMRFYTGEAFPSRYRGGIILAEHGSWNRDEKLGYRVMLVPLEGAEAKGYEPLVDGFLGANGEVLGRPVDVEILDDGSLLVSDDYNGAIYRVRYAG